mmetsp:Transcript_11/g.26  ORF Transcript_11/g.26 Transcript_11/m.26 type:complete len:281 (+) Transcript_11:1860-2702(+)
MNAGANSISRRFTCRSHLDEDAVPGVADDLLPLDFGVWVAVPPAPPLLVALELAAALFEAVASNRVLGATSFIRLFRRDALTSRSTDDRRVASDSFFLAILALADDSPWRCLAPDEERFRPRAPPQCIGLEPTMDDLAFFTPTLLESSVGRVPVVLDRECFALLILLRLLPPVLEAAFLAASSISVLPPAAALVRSDIRSSCIVIPPPSTLPAKGDRLLFLDGTLRDAATEAIDMDCLVGLLLALLPPMLRFIDCRRREFISIPPHPPSPPNVQPLPSSS